MTDIKKDFIDLVLDSSKDIELANRFIQLANKRQVKEEDLHALFVKEGYEGVSLADCRKIMGKLGATRPIVELPPKPDPVGPRAY